MNAVQTAEAAAVIRRIHCVSSEYRLPAGQCIASFWKSHTQSRAVSLKRALHEIETGNSAGHSTPADVASAGSTLTELPDSVT